MTVLQVAAPIAEELLARYVNQGQALVERASLVGDFSDYEAWKAARKQWIEQTVQALGHIYGSPDEAEEFKDAASAADSGKRWQQQYTTDLACVQAALDLLVAHHRQVQPAAKATGEPQPPEQPADDTESLDEVQATAELESSAAEDLATEPEPPNDDAEPATTELAAVPDPGQQDREQASNEGVGLMDEPAPLATPQVAVKPGRGSELAPTVGAELTPANGAGVAPQAANGAVSIPSGMRQVFVAHGRDERWMQAVAQLLEQAGPHTVTVLNERQDDRRSLTEQFEQQVAGSHYAVVLLTADDVGAPRLTEKEPYYSPRARQGVVFEMGFLVAALTPGCVCVLYEDGVELPCQLDGIVYVRLDYAGTWQSKLLLALRNAGFDYDLNKLAPV